MGVPEDIAAFAYDVGCELFEPSSRTGRVEALVGNGGKRSAELSASLLASCFGVPVDADVFAPPSDG